MSKVNWRKSATRDVRPFFGVSALENSTDHAEIRLFEDAVFSAETVFVVEPHELEKLSITVRPNFGLGNLSLESIKKGDLLLAVTAAQLFIKKTCVVTTLPITGKLPEEIPIGDEIVAQLGGGADIIVEVALCLAKRRTKQPGSPFLQGHWLSKKTFAIKAPKVADDFDVQPMDDEDWIEIGWPAKTLYSVEYLGGFNETAAKDRQLAKVRVHADVHKKLTVESNQRLAKPIMAALAAEITSQVVSASLSDWKGAAEVTPQSPLSAFLKRINRLQATSFDELKKLAEQPGTPKLKALLHADQQSVRSIAEG